MTATRKGAWPMATVAGNVFVRPLITDTVSLPPLAT